MPLEPRFGLFMSQANKPWSQILDEFVMADELGFDHAWLVDHLLDTDGPPRAPVPRGLDAARRTRRVNPPDPPGCPSSPATPSGTHRCSPRRRSRSTTSAAAASSWASAPAGTRPSTAGTVSSSRQRRACRRLEEAVEISCVCRRNPGSRSWHVLQPDDAVFEPRPVQRPRIPLLIAAHRPRMIRLAARCADQWDTFPELPGRRDGRGDDDARPSASRSSRPPASPRAAIHATVRRSVWAPAGSRREREPPTRCSRDATWRMGFTDISRRAGGVPANACADRRATSCPGCVRSSAGPGRPGHACGGSELRPARARAAAGPLWAPASASGVGSGVGGAASVPASASGSARASGRRRGSGVGASRTGIRTARRTADADGDGQTTGDATDRGASGSTDATDRARRTGRSTALGDGEAQPPPLPISGPHDFPYGLNVPL